MPSPELEEHYRTIIPAIFDGRVIPFLGAGANLCGRPVGQKWGIGQYLPKGDELADYLAEKAGCTPDEKKISCPCPKCETMVSVPEKTQDLSRISQYISITKGEGPLYDDLHELLAAKYPPTPLHQFLAGLPNFFRAKGKTPVPYQLIVTTNYDDVLECAFQKNKEPYDLVTYISEKIAEKIAEKKHQGSMFQHRKQNGDECLIEKPNEYINVSPQNGTVILKIHGALNRSDPDQDNYVITEDDYIDYLTRSDISTLIPKELVGKMMRSHFLFLGYSLSDWNMRAIFHQIWGQQTRDYRSWAVQLNPSEFNKKSWSKRTVDILDVSLEEYVETLFERMQTFKPGGGKS
jgi:hypothetical protein